MICATLLLTVAAAFSGVANPTTSDINGRSSPSSLNETCQKIAVSVSAASHVYNVVSPNYEEDISHWFTSSTQPAACSFEPGTVADVSIALQILGETRIPFAVKGGGHATNPGFSSTGGVQIAMSRFSNIDYDREAQVVEIGAGLTWDDVYAALEPHGTNVAGARVTGVGVAGLTLGGGYSWHTNLYGLTIDTVQGFELVMPNGTVANVTAGSNPDLFFALKGGTNNFGIVTKFTLRTFPQTRVWGGFIVYDTDAIEPVNTATVNFVEHNTDPKAVIITGYAYTSTQLFATATLFYDAPTPPSGIFDEFLQIHSLTQNVSTRSFLSFLQSATQNPTTPERGLFNTISLASYPLSLLQSIVNETQYWGKCLAGESNVVAYAVEPFLPILLTHNTTSSAYPPSRARPFSPLSIYFTWTSSTSDHVNQDAARASARMLSAGQNDAVVLDGSRYPNYAIFDTPLIDIYGANLPRLRGIKRVVDPENVMGLAGGFKL